MMQFIRPASMKQTFWVGHHMIEGSSVIFTVGTIDDAARPDSAGNRDWRELSALPDFDALNIVTELHGPFSTLADATATATALDMMRPARCRPENNNEDDANKRVVIISGKNTGKVFATGHQAAKNCDLDPSAVYRQLSGRAGFRTVKGYKFAYVKDLNEEMKQQLSL